MFISPAYAQAAGGAGPTDLLISLLPMVLIVAVFYFLLIRPQQKRMKEHQKMIANVSRGDRICTAGGILGKVTKVDEEELTVELAEGVRVQVRKNTLADVVSKSDPVSK